MFRQPEPALNFISEDPIFLGQNQNLTDPQSLNAYSYASDNPITKSDPGGLSTKDFVTAFAKQVVTSAFMLVAGTAYSIAHPISTLQALPGSISGVGSSLQNGYSSFRNGSDSDRGSVLGSLTVAVASLAMPESRAGAISDDALVVRGGGLANQSVGKINDAIRLSREKGVNGFSVQ